MGTTLSPVPALAGEVVHRYVPLADRYRITGRAHRPVGCLIGGTVFQLSEFPLSVCGCKNFTIDSLGDHVSTCTDYSEAKKVHDWVVDQMTDLFRTTHKVKTQQVVRNRGQRCGDIDLTSYLTNVVGPVPLVLDLLIDHDRWGSTSDPSINGHLHYPNDMDRSLDEAD